MCVCACAQRERERVKRRELYSVVLEFQPTLAKVVGPEKHLSQLSLSLTPALCSGSMHSTFTQGVRGRGRRVIANRQNLEERCQKKHSFLLGDSHLLS